MLCPECGNTASDTLGKCPICGSSLEIDSLHRTFPNPFPEPDDKAEMLKDLTERDLTDKYRKKTEKQKRELVYATFEDRFLAHVYDEFAQRAVGFFTAIALAFLIILLKANTGFDILENRFIFISVALLVFTCILWIYEASAVSSPRQGTVGKHKLGLKVTDTNGNRISFARASVRFWYKIFSGIIFCVGYFMICWTKKNQALHDLMADTVVVKEFE